MSDRKPNLILVICDDIGYGDLGCYGATMIKTPNLDRLAAAGARFTSMYSGGPTCSPSRAALLTGRVAPRTGVGRVLFPMEDRGLFPDERTIASYLRSKDYATGCFGKWHLGNLPERGPLRFGFDTYYGLPFSNDLPPLLLYRDEGIEETVEDCSKLTRSYADEAIRFIEATPAEKPLFCYVALAMPHYPITPGQQFAGVSDAGPYGDVCEEADHHVGRIISCMESVGRSEDTMFVFTSDHGPWFEGSTAGARGRKFETWDGGTRVPFILTWPGKVLPGIVVEDPVSTVDLLPTLCGTCGIDLDCERRIDGRSILSLLQGASELEPEPIWFFDGYDLNAVRLGKWKLHRRRQSFGGSRFGHMSLPQLFDMERDRSESYDLSKRHPDVVNRLMSLMEEFESTLDQSHDDGRKWWLPGDVQLTEADQAELDRSGIGKTS